MKRRHTAKRGVFKRLRERWTARQPKRIPPGRVVTTEGSPRLMRLPCVNRLTLDLSADLTPANCISGVIRIGDEDDGDAC
jgi:hypothetical protein